MTPFLNPTFLISILIALSVHEWAHGFVAHKLGDPTAEMAGRLTLNPLAHLDPLGTILFLFVGFGWGKPVPVNPSYFRHPKRDSALVSIAGPGSNLIMAFVCFLLLMLFFRGSVQSLDYLLNTPSGGSVLQAFVRSLLQSSLFLNLGLMAFNLLPIAPLDGSRILEAFIPWQYEERFHEYMRWGPYLLLFLLLAEALFSFPLLSVWIYGIMNSVFFLFSLPFGGF